MWTNVLESDQNWKKWIDASLVTFYRMFNYNIVWGFFFFLLLSQQKLFDWDGAAAVEWHKDPSGWWRVSADLGRPLLDAQRTKLQYLNNRYAPTGFCLLLQRFYGEHSRSDSCLQTRVSSGDVVSNIQVLMKSVVMTRSCKPQTHLCDVFILSGIPFIFNYDHNVGQPCRCCTRYAKCHAGTTTSPEAWLSPGWAITRAASPQTRAASTSGMLWRT